MESRSGKNSPDSLTFEQSLREIEKIVAQIESGKLPLAEVVAEFKRATELIRISRKLLTEVEQQIKQIEPELFKSSARRG
ncbi:MAG: exodeoxyribonuclease VII small subunit [Betaproteobacteria bacterium]|nr:exodeoxyribonuclease VII small subunit [Betaproteobacteria bacterium]